MHRIISSTLAVALTTGGSSAHIPTEQTAPPAVPMSQYVPAMWHDTIPIPDPPAPPAEVAAEAPVVPVAPAARLVVTSAPDDDPAIVAIITAAADEYGADPALMLRIMRCESRLDPDATNRTSGAAGLGQHVPQYWPARAAAIGMAGASPYDPEANARVTAWMLSTQGVAPWAASRSCWNR